jgi:hypothetical protein
VIKKDLEYDDDTHRVPLYLESSFFLLNFFLKKSREQALSRGNEGAIEGFCDNNPLEAASAAVEAGRVHSRPMSELEVRDRFMALPTQPFAALYASMKLFV